MLELLAPAKNLICGIAAIDCGADAVYIGAPKFGARSTAGNSIADIETLCTYAHRYNVKVFITFNTILSDAELEEAQLLINRLYDAGIDALIIQDLGILTLSLPPIALHASTQCNIRTPEKVQFLQSVGFKRVVLARELSLPQIKTIARVSNVELETFVHGSVCVSYSGQCYMSAAICSRSANRGKCAQCCRLPYTLKDATGKTIIHHKHLLSLKDMNRSMYLKELSDAGISSFKIEGRLKDVPYVKNITGYYRLLIDQLLKDSPSHCAASAGKTTLFFQPNPQKTFYRGSSDYFLMPQAQHNLAQFDTPKSIGEPIGIVQQIEQKYIVVSTKKEIHNGDGLCFINQYGKLQGFKVNKTIQNGIYPATMPTIAVGDLLYRNFDHEFIKKLCQNCSERKIEVDFTISPVANGFQLHLADDYGREVVSDIPVEKELVKNATDTKSHIIRTLSKLGNTIFMARKIICPDIPYFIAPSLLAHARRTAIEELTNMPFLSNQFCTKESNEHNVVNANFNKNICFNGDYRLNIYNQKAKQVYENHGMNIKELAFETIQPQSAELMRCKYCLKQELGLCHKQQTDQLSVSEPLYLTTQNHTFKLKFECDLCEMVIIKDKDTTTYHLATK